MPEPVLNFKEYFKGQQDWELAQIYHHGNFKVRDLAKQAGLSLGGFYRKLKEGGGYPDRRRPQHQAIYDLAERGLTNKQIADMIGCSDANVRYVLGKRQNARNGE